MCQLRARRIKSRTIAARPAEVNQARFRRVPPPLRAVARGDTRPLLQKAIGLLELPDAWPTLTVLSIFLFLRIDFTSEQFDNPRSSNLYRTALPR